MSFRVFDPSYDFIDERLNVFLGDRLSSVIAEVEGPLRIALVLYVVLYGVAILRGAISEPVMDFAVRSLKLAFLYLLATTAAYSTFVTEPLFTGLPNALTRAVGAQLARELAQRFTRHGLRRIEHRPIRNRARRRRPLHLDLAARCRHRHGCAVGRDRGDADPGLPCPRGRRNGAALKRQDRDADLCAPLGLKAQELGAAS